MKHEQLELLAELAVVAAGLGADVPVCLAACTAIVGGIGADVSDVPPLPGVGLVLANPGIALPTAEIFAAYAANTANTANNEDIADRADSIRFDAMPADALALAQQLAELRNDLGPAACRHARSRRCGPRWWRRPGRGSRRECGR